MDYSDISGGGTEKDQRTRPQDWRWPPPYEKNLTPTTGLDNNMNKILGNEKPG